MGKKKLLIIIAVVLVLLVGGLLIHKSIQKSQTRSWIERNMDLMIADSFSGKILLYDSKLPPVLKSDKDIRDSYEDLIDSIYNYNENIDDLEDSVDDLIHDLLMFGKDKSYSGAMIPTHRYGVEVGWFSVQTYYTLYLSKIQSYWIENYSAAIPVVEGLSCNFAYTIDQVIPESGKISNADSLKNLYKRTCTYENQTSVAEYLRGTPTPLVTPTSAPSATPTPVPLYTTSYWQRFEYCHPYANGSTIYLTRELNRGQLLVAMDITNEIDSRTIFEGETGTFNERNFIVSNNEQYVISDQEIWDIKDVDGLVKETDFFALAISPDDTQMIGYQDKSQDNGSFIVKRYDFPALETSETILTLDTDSWLAAEINWSGYSHDGAFFALSYTITPQDYTNLPEDASLEGNEISGFVLWETTNWEQIAALESNDSMQYRMAAFSSQDDYIAVGTGRLKDGNAAYIYKFYYSGLILFNLTDPANITSTDYVKDSGRSYCAIGSRSNDLFALACSGESIEIIDAEVGISIYSEDLYDEIYWPYFTNSGILYGRSKATDSEFQVYLPTDKQIY